MTFAVVEKHSEGYVLKPLKQKLFVDGLSYLLQEIYGIENKKADNAKVRSCSRARILRLFKMLFPPIDCLVKVYDRTAPTRRKLKIIAL